MFPYQGIEKKGSTPYVQWQIRIIFSGQQNPFLTIAVWKFAPIQVNVASVCYGFMSTTSTVLKSWRGVIKH